MAIEIHQTFAAIGINRTEHNLEMKAKNAKLEIHQEQAKIKIHSELPRVEIDQYEAFASAGLKNNYDMLKDFAQTAQQQIMEYIGKTASDGDQLARVEAGGNPIADICGRDASPEHEFNIDCIPKVGPEITVKGELEIEAEARPDNGVEITFTPPVLDASFTPSKVNFYLREKASISINYIGKNVDTYR